MILIFFVLNLFYLVFLVILRVIWRRIPQSSVYIYNPDTYVSVIIPVRNEAGYIRQLLKDLETQQYPKELYEIIVINDQSTDATREIVQSFIASTDITIRLEEIEPELPGGSHKKQAIQQAVNLARGELIITTDGDCRAGPRWIKSMVYPYQEGEACFVSGPVIFHHEQTWFEKMQTIEFASLQVTGAVSLYAGYPGMCNAANMAFSKSVFQSTHGYRDNLSVISGDDEFLLQSFQKACPDRLVFNKCREAVVNTIAQPDISNFFQQRRRWAGKWKQNKRWLNMILALLIFSYHSFFIVLVFNFMIGANDGLWSFLLLILVKILLEYLLLKNVLIFLNKKLNLPLFAILQMIYPFYVIFFGISANFGGFRWKGRSYKN